jgi:predicted nucleotidyltransferase
MDREERAELVERVTRVLCSKVEGSTVALRGSLASRTSDAFSDIDLLWEVSDAQFAMAVRRAEEYLTEVQEVASIRVDPAFARSDKRRLVYVRFADAPLFWRLDLDIMARSIGGDERYDLENPAAHDDASWSLAESALMNAIAAVKALARGDEGRASDLLRRGYERVGLESRRTASAESVRELARQVAKQDATLGELAAQIEDLADRALPAD